MKSATFLTVLMVLALAGCRESAPDLRVEQRTGDSARQISETSPKDGSVIVKKLENVKIVTGVPATVDDKNEPTAAEPKDKPGAVAVKMEY